MTVIVPECLIAPRSLGALMSLYEGNFLKLTGLAPRLRTSGAGPGQHAALVSCAGQDLDLHMTVEAATRYTVDLRLTYLFPEPAGLIADPDLRLRLYRDACMVEVLGWSGSHRHPVLRQHLPRLVNPGRGRRGGHQGVAGRELLAFERREEERAIARAQGRQEGDVVCALG